MMKKKVMLMVLAIAMFTSGCGDKEEIKEEHTKEDVLKEDTVQEDAPIEEEQNEEEPETFSFSKLENLVFYFASGAGGWRTELQIDADGSFMGVYSDSEMGSVGEEYPNGTYYYCTFEGAFTDAVKQNDYTYSMKLKELNCINEPGESQIIDEILYCSTTPFGIEGADEVLLYLPGAPTSELPEAYMGWVRNDMEDLEAPDLPFYGLYNVAEQNGFSSYKAVSGIDDYISSVEERSDAIKDCLENEVLTQSEMNEKSKELYDLWDGALNYLWAELKKGLPEEDFNILLDEQRMWIADKEAAVEAAGSEVEGGSMYPLVVNSVAAQITEERVYELMEWL
jgi:uncharacterized protein YecT (DUF1311 family)